MITSYLLASTLLLSQTGVMSQMIGVGFAPFELKKQVEELRQQIKTYKEERRARLEVSNYFSHEDFYHILDTKVHDLKVIQALLFRYKADFNKVRDSFNHSGDCARDKVIDIFGTRLYNYEYNKDITYIMLFLWDELRDLDISHEDKISEFKRIITKTKESLLFLRDFSLKRQWSAWDIFLLLYNIDINLITCSMNKEWDRCNKLLHTLDTIHIVDTI